MANSLNAVAKAGAMGVASICLVAFGIVLLLPGAVLTGMSQNSNFQSDFFAETNRGQLIAGITLLIISFTMIGIGIFLCVRVCRMDLNAHTSYTPAVTTTTTTYIATQGYPNQPQQYPGQPQQYPGQPQQYPGQPQQYPEPQQYPGQPQQYPMQQPQQYPGQPQQYPMQQPQQYSDQHLQQPDMKQSIPSAPAPAFDASPPAYSEEKS